MADMKNNRLIEPVRLTVPARLPALVLSEDLSRWLTQPRLPLLSTGDPLVAMFIKAMLTGEEAAFIYVGGATPGAWRRIKVSLVFRHQPGGRIYVSGYCPERSAHRIFSLDLIMAISPEN